MLLKSLENTPIADIVDAFNQSFADYELPLQFTQETMLQKILFEDIDLKYSVGAFDNDKLVGFIFFGIDGTTAWDGGTCVIPAYRGQKLTQRMLEYSFPILKAQGVNHVLLEVLENNVGARNIYESAGFSITRKLHGYKGQISINKNHNYRIEVLTDPDFGMLSKLGGFKFAWQQMDKRIQNRADIITTICIRNNNEIVAYMHFDAKASRVHQFGTAETHRRKGLASALFQYLAQNCATPILVVNIEDASEANTFIQSTGLAHLISQYEMAMSF